MLARLLAIFSKSRQDRDLDHELAAHLAMATEENIRKGMSEHQARRQAQIELGPLTQLKEQHRDTRGLPFLDTLLQDLRYTFRTLKRDTGFTIFAILIAGLGIGACATIFSVVNALLLRPLPFTDANQLVWIGNIADDRVSEWHIQVDHMLDLKAQTQNFSDLTGYFAYSRTGDTKLTGDGEPIGLTDTPVSCNFFPLLGVEPIAGRRFTADECKWNGPRAVLLTYGMWRDHYALNPGVVGRQIILNERPVTVVGVMPESFDFGSVFSPGIHVDVFSPFPLSPETNRFGNTLGVVGRLKPGANVQQAQAEFTILAKHLQETHLRDRNDIRPIMRPLDEHVNRRFRSALLVLSCAVGVVMLIVCANLANLQLARSATRQKELAIRVALGAGRARLIRQMLTESLVLAVCGILPGLLLAIIATRLVSHLESFKIPLLTSIRIDGTSLAFTVALAVITGLTFGLVAAFQAPSMDVQDTLKDGTRSASAGKRHNWIRGILVVSEIAFACVLLVGTGLLLRSFLHVLDVNLGFQPEHVAAVRIDPPRSRYDTLDKMNAYFDEVLSKTRATPGIVAAGITDTLPLVEGESSWGVEGKGQNHGRGKLPETFVRVVSEGYLQAAGIAFVDGRDFTERDTPTAEKVAVINETLARTLWPGEKAINEILAVDGGRRVVGIVRGTRHRALEDESGSEMYMPNRQVGRRNTNLVVHTNLSPTDLAAALRNVLKPIEPSLTLNEIRNLQTVVDKAASPRRFVVFLLSGFSIFALLLAALGIYALIAYSVNQRAQEFGIRLALGAAAHDLQGRVLTETLGLAAIGVAIGTAASWILARTLSGLLFGVTAADPLTFAAMVAVLTIVAAMAGYLPARRASKIDPMIALRGNQHERKEQERKEQGTDQSVPNENSPEPPEQFHQWTDLSVPVRERNEPQGLLKMTALYQPTPPPTPTPYTQSKPSRQPLHSTPAPAQTCQHTARSPAIQKE